MVRALVIGGNGFIGSHLVNRLVDLGFEVSVFDRFSSGFPRYAAKGVGEFRGEFGNRGALRDALRGQEIVFHLISLTTPATSSLDPAWDLRENVVPSIELAEMAAAAGVRHLYFASSGGSIYGNQATERLSEERVLYPASPYAIGKVAIEDFLRYFRSTGVLNSTVFRISNPFGPGQSGRGGHGLIPNVALKVMRGEPAIQYGDGGMIRDFVFIDDLIEMMARCVLAGDTRHDTYNLGSGIGHSVAQVLDEIETLLGPFKREIRPVPPGYVERVVLDIARFESEFGYTPEKSMTEGIRKTVAVLQKGDSS